MPYRETTDPRDLAGITHIDISDGTLEISRIKIGKWLERLELKRGSSFHPLYSQDFVRIVADNRNIVDKTYREGKYTAKALDIVGMALPAILVELATDENDRFLTRILFENVRARLMFVHPDSKYVIQRAMEDGDTFERLRGTLVESIRLVIRIFVRLRNLYERNRSEGRISPALIGSLEIKVTDFRPHFTIYRTDDSILWGIYNASVLGLHSSVLQVNESHGALFCQMLDHFDSIWSMRHSEERSDENFILRCHGRAMPTLNEKLIQGFFGESWHDLLIDNAS